MRTKVYDKAKLARKMLKALNIDPQPREDISINFDPADVAGAQVWSRQSRLPKFSLPSSSHQSKRNSFAAEFKTV